MNHLDPVHFHFAVLATDVALFSIRDNKIVVRMMRVSRPPHFPDNWGLPGGLIQPTETSLEAAKRLLKERAHIAPKKIYLEQLYTFDAIERDPRGRVVAVAHLGLIPWDELSEEEKADTKNTTWIQVAKAKDLAYDHPEVLALAKKRLASRVEYTTLIAQLMPHDFTLSELENAYTSILGTKLDKRNFRKKILKLKILTKVPRKRRGGRARPAQLYRFTSSKVHEINVL
jgi:8-oxo-dGTP diphosphatase